MKVAQCTTVHFKKGGAGRLPLARRADRNTLLNRAHRLASEILLGNPKTELLDCLMVANPTHNQIVTCLWRTREEKATTIETPAALHARAGHGCYCFVGEAWMASYPRGTSLCRPDVMPADRPDRIEVVMIVAANQTEENTSALRDGAASQRHALGTEQA